MLDHDPVLKERVMGIGAFLGIGIFAVAAVNLMISGGFDFGPGRAPYDRDRPSPYVQMADAARYVSDSFSSAAWADTSAPDTSQSEERLVGEDDGAPSPQTVTAVSDTDLYQEIDALYERGDASYAEDESYDEAAEEEAAYVDEYPAEDDSSASENASPW